MTCQPQQQVVVKENDAVLTAAEIRACIMFALHRVVNDQSVSEVERNKHLAISRCLLTENAAAKVEP